MTILNRKIWLLTENKRTSNFGDINAVYSELSKGQGLCFNHKRGEGGADQRPEQHLRQAEQKRRW